MPKKTGKTASKQKYGGVHDPGQAGNSRKPAKLWKDPEKTPDGLPLTAEEKAAMARRQERAKVYLGGEATATSKKAVRKEALRHKLGRLEERIADAAEVSDF